MVRIFWNSAVRGNGQAVGVNEGLLSTPSRSNPIGLDVCGLSAVEKRSTEKRTRFWCLPR